MAQLPSKFPPVAEQLDLIRAGSLNILSEAELEQKLEKSAAAGEPLRIKQGFDPTRPDLHIGHAVSMRKLRVFQELGHQVIFVVGDYTALVGDPTGRSELRPKLSELEIAENARTYAEQAFTILDADRTRLEFNSSWLRPLQLADLLRLMSTYTVARMLEREDFSRRYSEELPISLVELMYPLMQAYDSVALEADVELGGSDQTFNLLVARDIQKSYGQEPQVCLTMPLLRGTDGVQKMSKSYDNYVALTDPPEEQFGKTMSIPDTLLEEWFGLASGLTGADLEQALAESRADPYAAKRRLGRSLVSTYHGDAAAEAAERRFDTVHRDRDVPEDVPSIALSPDDPDLGIEGGSVWLPRLLVAAELAPSTSQAIRLIEQNAVSVDSTKVTDRSHRLPATGEYLLQRGKRHFTRVRFEPGA